MAFLVYVKDAGSSDPGEIVGSVLFLLIMAAFLALRDCGSASCGRFASTTSISLAA
jgi:hypothetical protein